MDAVLAPRRGVQPHAPVADGFAHMARIIGAALGDGPAVSRRTELFRPLPDNTMQWLYDTFPSYFQNAAGERIPMAPHHEALWDWFWRLRPGVEQPPLIAILARGGG